MILFLSVAPGDSFAISVPSISTSSFASSDGSQTGTAPEVQPEPKGAKKRIAALETELQSTKDQLSQANTSLQAALAENQRNKDQINQLTGERDATQSKVKELEGLRVAYVARFNQMLNPPQPQAQSPTVFQSQTTISDEPETVSGLAHILARYRSLNTETTQEETPPASDSLVASLPGFHPGWYRRNVERKIRTALDQLSSPAFGTAKVSLTFDILPDGTAEHLQVMAPKESDTELTQKIEQRARYIILSASPFPQVSNPSVSALRMIVEVQNYSVSAHYADKPNVVSALPSSEH